MHTNFLHKLSTGGIVSLPAPTFTLYRCVVEEPDRLLALFGVKTPTDESAEAVLQRCKSAAPDLEWMPHLHDGWHTNGATEGMQFYEIQKVDGRASLDPRGRRRDAHAIRPRHRSRRSARGLWRETPHGHPEHPASWSRVERVAPGLSGPRSPGGVALDASGVGRDAGRVAEEVIQHLETPKGAKVRVTLEITAEIPNGTPENVQRTVTENATSLRFTSHGFETA